MMITLLLCLFTRLSTRSLGLPFTHVPVHALKPLPFPLTLQPLVSTISLSCFELDSTYQWYHTLLMANEGSANKKAIPPCVKSFELVGCPITSALMCLRKILNLQMLQFCYCCVKGDSNAPSRALHPKPRNYVSYYLLTHTLYNMSL